MNAIMPISSPEAAASLQAQYDAVRMGVAVTDGSAWGKIRVSGDMARDVLDRALTGNVQNLMENGILHTMALTADGEFAADVFVLGGFEDFILLSRPEYGDALLAAVRTVEGSDEITIEDVTATEGMVRIDGPETADLPRMILGSAVSGMRIMTFTETEFDGAPLIVGRMGLTGEFGFFFLGAPDVLTGVLAAIHEAAPGAVDCDRSLHHLCEMETRTFNSVLDLPKGEFPLEAGLHWMVDFRKPEFVGREPFLARFEAGLARRMVCVRLDQTDVAPERLGAVTLADGKDIGYVANGAWSPALGTGIALVYVDTGLAAVGLPVTVATPSGPKPGRTVSAPFFKTRSNVPR